MSSGRGVLVLGGGSGIGLKAIEYLLTQTKAKVVCLSLMTTPECDALEIRYANRFWSRKGDVTKKEDFESIVELSLDKMGGAIHSMVYCAGLLYVQRCAQADMDMVRKFTR